MPRTRLRPHQIEAVEAAAAALEAPPGRAVPSGGLRATVVSATGTGKTLIAVHTARRLAPRGRVLVVVPTLDLLVQTARAWRAEGRAGRAVAVCSLPEEQVAGLAVRTTTSAPQLALWSGRAPREEPWTVFATYASLPVVLDAHVGGYGLAGLPAWDLVVVDEAHRTSGHLGKQWADVHRNSAVPAARRLYMTATPRIWEAGEPGPGRTGPGGGSARRPLLTQELAASMDDEELFGPVVFELKLTEAIDRGLLARFQIIVAETSDPDLWAAVRNPRTEDRKVRGKRLSGMQAAVLRACAQYSLDRVLTFHHRTADAELFATTLPQTAHKLARKEPDLIPEGGLHADWISGEHSAERRRGVLARLGGEESADGAARERVVVSNCRVLGEGVDVPALDGVVFCDVKTSVVDTVQAVGRALRQTPGHGKTAALVVPVFLAPGEAPDEMFASSSYEPLAKLLLALRSHDEDLVERLAVPQERSAAGERGEATALDLRFATPRSPVTVARFVRLQVIDPERQVWLRGMAAAARYFAEHGHLRVPYHHKDGGRYPLGMWVAEQRRIFHAGRMKARRAAQLEEVGMVWHAPDFAWSEGLEKARAYAGVHGHLAPPVDLVWDGYPLGKWLANQRSAWGRGALSQQRQDALGEIAGDWAPRWDIGWQRRMHLLVDCIEAGATLAEILPGVRVGGEDVGAWLRAQRTGWDALEAGQRRLLEDLGVVPAERQRPRGPRRSHEEAFRGNLAAAAQYREREGHLEVPRAHREAVTDAEGREHVVRLGVWVSNVRARRERLGPDRVRALDQLGIRWS